jgi:radical SAM protein (TIGR01212 family)
MEEKTEDVMLYNNLSGYFRTKYGRRLSKICIDGGFSCPNRDGRCGLGGCIYCGERGAGEHIDPSLSIRRQVETALSSAKEDDLFVAYFQNFTNTYASVEVLKERYDSALIDERIKVLAIGTRPDCIDEEKAKLIASYKDKVDVWVELGLQTASDKTADIINRGYHKDIFEKAMEILTKYQIPVVVHLIVGLPGEDINDIKETVEYTNGFKIFGIKIHSIYVMKDTELEKMYLRGEYTPLSMSEYIDSVIYILTHISPAVIVHRLTGDCPRDMLVAPDWNRQKNEIINTIVYKMQFDRLYQGCKY